jgi:AcrR family transcriptional regulator
MGLREPGSIDRAGRSPSRRERHRAETGDRLYREALRLFAERGFAATTVEDITEAADVGKGTFFNYFPSKEHILATFGERRRAQIAQALLLSRQGSASIHDVLEAMVGQNARELGQSPALLRSIFAAHASSDAVCSNFRQHMQRSRQMLAELMAIGQQRGEIRRDRKPRELAGAFQSALVGATLFWAMDPHGALEKQSAKIWEYLWPGLSAGPKRGAR